MPTFFNEVFWRLMFDADLRQYLLLLLLMFSEVNTKPALTVLNLQHWISFHEYN